MLEFNLTSVIQLLNFLILMFFLMKFLFKPFLKTLDERKEKIRKEFMEAEKLRKEAEEYNEKAKMEYQNARNRAMEIIEKSKKEAEEFLKTQRESAKMEAKRMIDEAKMEIERMKEETIKELRMETLKLSVFLASKILEREVDERTHREYLMNMLERIAKGKRKGSGS